MVFSVHVLLTPRRVSAYRNLPSRMGFKFTEPGSFLSTELGHLAQKVTNLKSPVTERATSSQNGVPICLRSPLHFGWQSHIDPKLHFSKSSAPDALLSLLRNPDAPSGSQKECPKRAPFGKTNRNSGSQGWFVLRASPTEVSLAVLRFCYIQDLQNCICQPNIVLDAFPQKQTEYQ